MLSLLLTQQGLGLEAGGRRYSEQLISLRPGASIVCRAVSSVEVSQKMTAAPAAEEFIRPHLRKLAAYTPIEPFEVLSKRLGRDALDIVKLDANENPYGPPPEVLEALGLHAIPKHLPRSRDQKAAICPGRGQQHPCRKPIGRTAIFSAVCILTRACRMRFKSPLL